MNEKKYLIWFSSINILPIKKIKLMQNAKEIEKIYKLTEKELLKIEGLNLLDVAEIAKNKDEKLLEKYENYINKNEIEVISINDKQYPEKLKNIYDPPVIIFAKGNMKLLNEKAVAIVGSRETNEYGKKQAYEISYNLSKNNITIVSGLAKGIDEMAHLGALNANKNTIAVIGTGHDIVYPKENKNIYGNIIKDGLVISEYLVGTKPMPKNFPMRNRIVAAIADAVLVIQARKNSGAIITADFALEYGKNIYALPGNVDNFYSEGSNLLIKEGANVIINYKNILEDFA